MTREVHKVDALDGEGLAWTSDQNAQAFKPKLATTKWLKLEEQGLGRGLPAGGQGWMAEGLLGPTIELDEDVEDRWEDPCYHDLVELPRQEGPGDLKQHILAPLFLRRTSREGKLSPLCLQGLATRDVPVRSLRRKVELSPRRAWEGEPGRCLQAGPQEAPFIGSRSFSRFSTAAEQQDREEQGG